MNAGILNEERTFANSGQLYAYYNSRGYPISSTGVVSGICRLPNSLYRGYTFTVTVDGLFLYQGVNANILNTDNAYVAYDFIKKVDISSPYTEKESVVLTSDRPITKWDKLVEQGGEIGWLYQSAIDTDIRPSRTDLFPYGFKLYKNHSNGVYTYTVTNIKKIKGYQTSYCKQFKNVDGSYNTGELYRYSDQPSMQSQYFNTDIATKEEFIKWMENNPLTMVYKTEETEFIPLPQSEQNAIRALKTYYPTTVITADGGELDPDIKVTYRKSSGVMSRDR